MPGPPVLGSSSGGTGVGMDVAVDVGTGVRVGVIVGGGVAVGVLVATMSYEPAEGGLVACGVGVAVGGAVACAVAVGVSTVPGGGGDGVPEPGSGVGVRVGTGDDTVNGVRVGIGSVPGDGVGDSPDVGVGVDVDAAGVAVGGSTVTVGVTVGVAVEVAVAVGVTVGVTVGVAVAVGVGVTVGVAVGVGVGVNGACATRSVAAQFSPPDEKALGTTLLGETPFARSVSATWTNVVPISTLMTYGDSPGASSRTQIPSGAMNWQTTAIGSASGV